MFILDVSSCAVDLVGTRGEGQHPYCAFPLSLSCCKSKVFTGYSGNLLCFVENNLKLHHVNSGFQRKVSKENLTVTLSISDEISLLKRTCFVTSNNLRCEKSTCFWKKTKKVEIHCSYDKYCYLRTGVWQVSYWVTSQVLYTFCQHHFHHNNYHPSFSGLAWPKQIAFCGFFSRTNSFIRRKRSLGIDNHKVSWKYCNW